VQSPCITNRSKENQDLNQNKRARDKYVLSNKLLKSSKCHPLRNRSLQSSKSPRTRLL